MQFHFTYKWKISNKLILRIVHITFFNDMINIKDFDSSLINKNRQKNHTKTLVFTTLDALQ